MCASGFASDPPLRSPGWAEQIARICRGLVAYYDDTDTVFRSTVAEIAEREAAAASRPKAVVKQGRGATTLGVDCAYREGYGRSSVERPQACNRSADPGTADKKRVLTTRRSSAALGFARWHP
jgi:hypothetical protein